MRKNLIIVLGAVALLVIVALGWFISKGTIDIGEQAMQAAPTEDPLDVTIDFYNSWLGALQSTTTDPYQSGLDKLPVLSVDVQTYIEKKRTERKDGDVEGVICQLTPPPRIGGTT